MNILFILNYYGIHGSSISLLNIVSILKKNNYNIYFLASDGELKNKYFEVGTSISVFNKKNYLPSLTKLIHIKKLIIDWDIDTVIGLGKFNSLESQLSNTFFLKKEPISILNFSREYHWNKYPKWSLPNIGYMMVNSKYYKDNAIKRYQWNDKNISVLSARYNVPNELSIKPIFKKKKFEVMFVRRLDNPKYKSVIKVLDQIIKWKIRDNMSIKIVGGGREEELVKNKIAALNKTFKGLQIKFLGKRNNVSKIMKSSDIIVGSERVAVEGISYGKLVLLANDDGLIDIIRPDNIQKFNYDNYFGINYSTSTIKKIEKDLIDILKDDKKRTLIIKNNYKFVKDNLKVEKGAEVISSIISKSKSGSLNAYQIFTYSLKVFKSWFLIYFLLISNRSSKK